MKRVLGGASSSARETGAAEQTQRTLGLCGALCALSLRIFPRVVTTFLDSLMVGPAIMESGCNTWTAIIHIGPWLCPKNDCSIFFNHKLAQRAVAAHFIAAPGRRGRPSCRPTKDCADLSRHRHHVAARARVSDAPAGRGVQGARGTGKMECN